jgi:HEAT repeat protein
MNLIFAVLAMFAILSVQAQDETPTAPKPVFTVAAPTPAPTKGTPTPTPLPKKSKEEWIKDLSNPNPQVHSLAAKVLGDMREDAVPELIKALSSPSPLARALSASVLMNLGIGASSAKPKLKALLTGDKEEGVRLRAAQALGRIEIEAAYVVPELIKCLGHCSNWGRAEAARILSEFGKTAKSALPALKKAEGDPIADVRSAAKSAAQKIEVEIRP